MVYGLRWARSDDNDAIHGTHTAPLVLIFASIGHVVDEAVTYSLVLVVANLAWFRRRGRLRTV